MQWLKANKISLNPTKSEIVIFRPKHKNITKHMNLRISDQRVHLSSKVRYLGVVLQENLEWEQHLNTLTPKLNSIWIARKNSTLCSQILTQNYLLLSF